MEWEQQRKKENGGKGQGKRTEKSRKSNIDWLYGILKEFINSGRQDKR